MQGQQASTLPTVQNPPPTSYSRAGAMFAGVMDAGKATFALQRPWMEVLDRDGFGRPESVSDASSRMKKNLSYFRMNYIVFALGVLALSLLWHPGSLVFLLVLLVAWVYLYFSRTEPLVLFERTFSDREVLFVLGVTTFIVIFATNTGTNIVSSLALAAAFIAVHSALRVPDDLFLDEQENASSAYISFQPQVAGGRV